MITSDSLSTGFSSGLQEEETGNPGALHWGSVPTPEAQMVSSVLRCLILAKASGPQTEHPKPKPPWYHPGVLGTPVSSHEHCPLPTPQALTASPIA